MALPQADATNEVIRAPIQVRLMGAWMLVVVTVASLLIVTIGVASGEFGTLLVLPLWTLPGGLYGLRVTRLAVVANARGLTVHNRYRTRSVAWSEVGEVAFEKRPGPWWYRLVLLWGRWVGVIRLVDGTEIEVEATETMWANWTGRLFTGSKRSAEERTSRLREMRARFCT